MAENRRWPSRRLLLEDVLHFASILLLVVVLLAFTFIKISSECSETHTESHSDRVEVVFNDSIAVLEYNSAAEYTAGGHWRMRMLQYHERKLNTVPPGNETTLPPEADTTIILLNKIDQEILDLKSKKTEKLAEILNISTTLSPSTNSIPPNTESTTHLLTTTERTTTIPAKTVSTTSLPPQSEPTTFPPPSGTTFEYRDQFHPDNNWEINPFLIETHGN